MTFHPPSSPSGSPRRSPSGRTIALYNIPYETHPSEVLEHLQSLAGRLQRACTTRSSTPQQQQPESVAIPSRHSRGGSYSLKAEFSTRDAASKAHDLLLPHHDLQLLPSFVLEEDDTLLDIPVILSSTTATATQQCSAQSSPRSDSFVHGRRTSEEHDHPPPHPSPWFNTLQQQHHPLYAIADHGGLGFNPSVSFSSGSGSSSLASPHLSPSRLAHSRQGSHSTFSSAPSVRSSPSAQPQLLVGSSGSTFLAATTTTTTTAPIFSLPPFDFRDPFHSQYHAHGPTALGGGGGNSAVHHAAALAPDANHLLFDPFFPMSSMRPKLLSVSSTGALAGTGGGGYPNPPSTYGRGYPPTHARSQSFGQTPTQSHYPPQAPYPFQPHNVDYGHHPPAAREEEEALLVKRAAMQPPPQSPLPPTTARVTSVPVPVAAAADEAVSTPASHMQGAPSASVSVVPVPAPVPVPAVPVTPSPVAAPVAPAKKLDFRAALTAGTGAGTGTGTGAGVGVGTTRPAHLVAHTRSQSIPVVPAPAATHTHTHTRASSSMVASPLHHGNNGHRRAKSSVSSAHSKGSSTVSGGSGATAFSSVTATDAAAAAAGAGAAAIDHQKTYAFDPHRGPRSTDWMLSVETLAARPAKDAKFAQMVAMGLAKGRTKAGWAQARRPGKRDRDAAKRRLAEIVAAQQQEQEGQQQQGEGLVDGLAEQVKVMVVA